MKILFLDIDGVLNSTRTCVAFGGYPHTLSQRNLFDPVAIQLIQRLCDNSGAKVVLSSAWRTMYHFSQVGSAFDLPIIDRTPSLSGPRGEEIQYWLDQHSEVSTYAIVDDDPDMLPTQMPQFVQTSGHNGLQWHDFERLCALLGCNPYDAKVRQREWRREGERLDFDENPTGRP